MRDYSFKAITAGNLPIYLYGAFGNYSIYALDWLKEHGGFLTAVFDQNFQVGYNTDCYSNYIKRYEEMGLRVLPPPNDIGALSRGVVIIAVKERSQRECQARWAKGGWHEVVDIHDIICHSEHSLCLGSSNSDNILEKCSSCSASYRHCPVRSQWYQRTTGLVRDKVIRHIAVKAGFICNLKCKSCCEFIPFFIDKHRCSFDAAGIISDIEKLSNSLEYIWSLSFSGGDVMLNKDLGLVIEKTVQFENIRDIYCLTNGTYIPPAEVLDAIQNTHGRVRVVINNYEINSRAVPLVEELNRRSITNLLRDNAGWYDLNDHTFKNRSVEALKKTFNTCAFDAGAQARYYHIMVNGKVNERCGVANSILYYLDKWNELTSDYVDIRALSEDRIPAALTALEDRGYLDICNFCTSASADMRVLGAATDQL